jgi:hypothetical protein
MRGIDYQWQKEFNATVAKSAARLAALKQLAVQAQTDANARKQLVVRQKQLDAEIKLIQLRSEWDLCVRESSQPRSGKSLSRACFPKTLARDSTVRCDRLAVVLTCRPLLFLLPQEFQKLVAVDVQEELFPVGGGRMEPDSRTSSKPGRRQRNHSSLPLLAPTSIHKKSKTGVGRTLPSAAFVVIRLHAVILSAAKDLRILLAAPNLFRCCQRCQHTTLTVRSGSDNLILFPLLVAPTLR